MPCIIPLTDLSQADRMRIRAGAKKAVLDKAVELNIGKPGDIVVRDAVMGDVTTTQITDFADVINDTTTVAAGQEFWGIDSTEITAYDLSQVIKGYDGGNVKNKNVIGVFGFFDNTATPDLTAIRLKRGSDTLDFWETEQCYANTNEFGGMIDGVIIWEEQDPFAIDMNFKTAADKLVGLYALVAERYGEHISAA